MSTDIEGTNPPEYIPGAVVAKGKTKILYQVRDHPDLVRVVSKDDITAGDGARHDILPGKGKLANQTTCNVFRYLQNFQFPLAFVENISGNSFIAKKCQMLPYEVVVRREAHGSYLERNIHIKKRERLEKLEAEIFLKTKDRRFKNLEFTCDDPYLVGYYDDTKELLFLNPHMPLSGKNEPKLVKATEVFNFSDEWKMFDQMKEIAVAVFLKLEELWTKEGFTLADFKVEFGFSPTGNLLLADVIDNDSWRVLNKDGKHVDKQLYRKGAPLNEVFAAYTLVAEISEHFGKAGRV